MKTGKASGWGGFFSYHWVELEGAEENQYADLDTTPQQWCVRQYGAEGVRWFAKKEKFYFQSEEDLSMFILRWI